jgi:hypothetical protein
VGAVVATARTVFGVTPDVAPESAVIRGLLDGLVEPGVLTKTDWHGILLADPAEPRAASPRRPPVIGRHSRDGYEKWPDADAVRSVYPVDGSRDVRVLGGAAQASRRTGLDVETAWTVHPFGSLPPRTFLDQLDFWVYFHGPELYESFGMAIVEAPGGVRREDQRRELPCPARDPVAQHVLAEQEVALGLGQILAERVVIGELQQLELADLQDVGGLDDLVPLPDLIRARPLQPFRGGAARPQEKSGSGAFTWWPI